MALGKPKHWRDGRGTGGTIQDEGRGIKYLGCTKVAEQQTRLNTRAMEGKKRQKN